MKSIRRSCLRKNFVELSPQASDKQKGKYKNGLFLIFFLWLYVPAYVLKPNPDWLLYFHVFTFHLSLQHGFRIWVDNCCSTTNNGSIKVYKYILSFSHCLINGTRYSVFFQNYITCPYWWVFVYIILALYIISKIKVSSG